MNVEHKASNMPGTNDEQPFLRFNREYACTCCCFNRPSVEIHFVEGNQDRYIGRIVHECGINIWFRIYDANGIHKFNIFGESCQLGLCCPLPCEACQKVDFEIQDASGRRSGTIQKV